MAKAVKSIDPAAKSRLLSLEEFEKLKFDHIIKLSDAGVDQKLIAYWRREGLLDFFQKGKWARLSFMQVLWLRVLNTLRDLGCPLSTLKKMHEYFLKRAYFDDVPRLNFLSLKEKLERKQKDKTITEKEIEDLKLINTFLMDKGLMYGLKLDINYFSNLISEFLRFRTETGILIYPNGVIAEYSDGTYFTNEPEKLDPSAPHIYLPLKHYMVDFIEDEQLSQFISPLELLNEYEQKVLREMRNKNVREISIQLDGGKIRKIESTKNGTITGSQAKEIRKILGLGNYEEIKISTMDESSLAFKKTKKKI